MEWNIDKLRLPNMSTNKHIIYPTVNVKIIHRISFHKVILVECNSESPKLYH